MRGRLRLWALGLIGALGLGPTAGCGTRTAAVAPDREAGAPAGELQQAEVKKPRTPEELLAPFPVVSQLQFRPMPELLAETLRVTGRVAAPVNTEEADRDFFTAPEFDEGENNGRLFHTRFILSDGDGGWISLNYICWQPLGSREMMAQLLHPRPGMETGEVTTDGKKLFVPHDPAGGKGKRRVDAYTWEGDAHGKGHFVLEGTAPILNLPLPLK